MKKLKRYAHVTFMVLMLAVAISVIVFSVVKRAPHTQAQTHKNHQIHSANKRYSMQLHMRI